MKCKKTLNVVVQKSSVKNVYRYDRGTRLFYPVANQKRNIIFNIVTYYFILFDWYFAMKLHFFVYCISSI